MPLRVCITSIGDSLSTRGFADDDFARRISIATEGQVCVTFIKDKRGLYRYEARSTPKHKWLPLWLSYLWVFLTNLHRLVRQDILIADGIGPTGLAICLFCTLFRKKSMITIHGHYDREWLTRNHSRVATLLFMIGSKVILRLSDLFVVNEQHIGQELMDKGVESSHLFTRYVFADTAKFSRDNVDIERLRNLREQYGLPDKYILYVGDLSKWDGADDMLRMFQKICEKIPDAGCLLVGSGPLKLYLESFIDRNNLTRSVFHIEWIDYEMMPLIYYGAQVIILPNHPPRAGLGRIGLEGLSMEVPVIGYDAGELYKVIQDGKTGYLIPEGNIDLMSAKAVSLLTNPELRRRFGANGRMLVHNTYDLKNYIDNWLHSFEYLISSSRS